MLGVTIHILLLALQILGLTASASPSTACGEIVNNKNAAFILFNAKQAYNCLTSVPFDAGVATRLLQYLNDTIQFHSTLAYLANPPPTYQQPAVDLVAGLAQIQRHVDEGFFQNEYAFEATLKQLLNAAHDDHLSMTGGILSAFVFGSPYDLVSVSSDGFELPKIYVANDLRANETKGLPWRPSAIATIEGEDVVEYLTRFAARNSVGKLEPHADWNMLMRSGALDVQGQMEVFFGGAPLYPNDTITIAFENGTERDPVPWQALYLSPGYTGPLETGGDFYNFFVLGLYPASYTESLKELSSQKSASTTSTPSSPEPTSKPVWDSAYPEGADVEQRQPYLRGYGLLRGYFLKESSLAVLSIPQFASSGPIESKGFVETIKDFLRRSKEEGMKQVVIDVQQNMGGQPLLAIETFRLFFPSMSPFAGSRRRDHPMADTLGRALTPYWESLTPNETLYYSLLTNEWVVTNRLDAYSGREFLSWQDYFGPGASYGGDNYTKTELYDLTNTEFLEEAGGFAIEHFDKTTPYSADDIIILSDGLCSSACALFMELMHKQANVSTVAAGGRPNYAPMQAPSGTRGAVIYTADNMDRDIRRARRMNNTTDGVLPFRGLDFTISAASVNLRDQVRYKSNDSVQFLYEPANCRIFFTPKTWYNYTNLWLYAAEAVWRNPKLCVGRSNSTTSYHADVITPYQIDVGDNHKLSRPGDHRVIDNPSNNLQGIQYDFQSSYHRACRQDKSCPGSLYCGPVNVFLNGETITEDRCLRTCSNARRLHNYGCNLDSTCVFVEDYLPEGYSQPRSYSTGYCRPNRPLFSSAKISPAIPEDQGVNVDECFKGINWPKNGHTLECFNLTGNVNSKRCHVWTSNTMFWHEEDARYCNATSLANWRFSEQTKCCPETLKPGPASVCVSDSRVARFWGGADSVFFTDPHTEEGADLDEKDGENMLGDINSCLSSTKDIDPAENSSGGAGAMNQPKQSPNPQYQPVTTGPSDVRLGEGNKANSVPGCVLC